MYIEKNMQLYFLRIVIVNVLFPITIYKKLQCRGGVTLPYNVLEKVCIFIGQFLSDSCNIACKIKVAAGIPLDIIFKLVKHVNVTI